MHLKGTRNAPKERYHQWHRAMAEGEDAKHLSRLQPWHETVLNLLPDLRDLDVLEIGCGRGDFAFELAQRFPRARVSGIDFSDQAIDIAKGRLADGNAPVQFSVANAQALPYKTDSFDWTIFL